jgi:hypothetical protein
MLVSLFATDASHMRHWCANALIGNMVYLNFARSKMIRPVPADAAQLAIWNWLAAFLLVCALGQEAHAQTPSQPPAQSAPPADAPPQTSAPSQAPAQIPPQGPFVERDVRAMPGSDVRVGIYTSIKQDCTSGPLPAIRLVTPPAHGTITVKRGMLKATNFKQCLATDIPAFVAFYRAAQNFNGADEFEIEVNYSGGRKQTQHFRVSVSNTPNRGQGI